MPAKSSVFVDTSGWAEPLMGNSAKYDAASKYYRQLIAQKRPLLTTNYVLSELVALLTTKSRFARPQILTILQRIKTINQLEIIHIDEPTDAAAWDLLQQYTDKDWSLVDAASFVVMRQRAISEAFTTDHHFTQAGFVRAPQ